MQLQLPTEINIIENSFTAGHEYEGFTQRFEEFGLDSTSFLVQQCTIMYISIGMIVLLLISFICVEKLKEAIRRFIHKTIVVVY